MRINRVDQMDNIVDAIVILSILAIIILKITNVITIPWLLLLSPIWVGVACGLVVILYIMIVDLIKTLKRRKNNERN